MASSFFSLFFKFLCGKDGAQQSIAGSGRIQAPFHGMPMLITHNNHDADRARRNVCNTLIFLCVLGGQNCPAQKVPVRHKYELILLTACEDEGCIHRDITKVSF